MARVEQSIEVNVPVRTAYNQLTQFEEFPRFMEGVHSVRQIDDAHLHWHAEKGGRNMEWDAEIMRQIPDQCIAWRNTSGPKNEGEVRFESIGREKTRITLTMEADDVLLKHPGEIGDAALKPDQDLARFKKMIESQTQATDGWRGEIRDGQRVDNTENIEATPGGSVVGQTTDQILEEMSDTAFQIQKRAASMARRRARELQRNWSTEALVPDFFQVWDAQLVFMRWFSDQMGRLFLGWMPGVAWSGMPSPGLSAALQWMPSVEVSEQDGRLVVCADLPGLKKEDIQVEVDGDRLIIEGERREEMSHARYSERSHGRFLRTVALPRRVDAEGATAAMHDGVLEVFLPLPQGGSAARKLEIQ
ncbi:MAG: Hsp20 family protein [Burkholderiales bacterium]|nr:Hsp20 family protein [Burkholderiales bacterium]